MKKYIEAIDEVYRRCLRHYNALKEANIGMPSYKARVQFEDMTSAIISVLAWDYDISIDDYNTILEYRDLQHKTFLDETK